MVLLEDHSAGLLYPTMTNGQRVTASKDTGDLHWVGANVVAASGVLAAGRHVPSGHVQMYAPAVQEPGSSVSHFDTACTPNEIMEPVYTGPDHTPGLALDLMADLSWSTNAPTCGNGAFDGGEGCDDGNTTSGDGCSMLCQIEACFTCSGAPSSCSPITACVNADGCCPIGCNPGNDTDCVAVVPAVSTPGWVALAALLMLAGLRSLRMPRAVTTTSRTRG
jgi:cysteine-rich repeat protein